MYVTPTSWCRKITGLWRPISVKVKCRVVPHGGPPAARVSPPGCARAACAWLARVRVPCPFSMPTETSAVLESPMALGRTEAVAWSLSCRVTIRRCDHGWVGTPLAGGCAWTGLRWTRAVAVFWRSRFPRHLPTAAGGHHDNVSAIFRSFARGRAQIKISHASARDGVFFFCL